MSVSITREQRVAIVGMESVDLEHTALLLHFSQVPPKGPKVVKILLNRTDQLDSHVIAELAACGVADQLRLPGLGY